MWSGNDSDDGRLVAMMVGCNGVIGMEQGEVGVEES